MNQREVIHYESMGYAFFKSCGISETVINEPFMLGFVFALAEYDEHMERVYSTIKEAFADYFNESDTNTLLKLAKDFKENQNEWVRWPSIPID